jgi:hypothetical protein
MDCFVECGEKAGAATKGSATSKKKGGNCGE